MFKNCTIVNEDILYDYHSYLSASSGLIFCARFDGKIPVNTPTITENTKIIIKKDRGALNKTTFLSC